MWGEAAEPTIRGDNSRRPLPYPQDGSRCHASDPQPFLRPLMLESHIVASAAGRRTCAACSALAVLARSHPMSKEPYADRLRLLAALDHVNGYALRQPRTFVAMLTIPLYRRQVLC